MSDTATLTAPSRPQDDGRHAWHASRVAIIANTKSGPGQRGGDVAEAAETAITAAGGQVVAGWRGESISRQSELAREGGANVIVSVGGDGTAVCAARLAVDLDAALLIIPSGTMNLVAKDLGLFPHAAPLDRMTDLTPTRVDFASVNGHLFLHSALLGLMSSLNRERERIRGDVSLRARAMFVQRSARAVLRTPRLRITASTPRGVTDFVTRSVAVTNNPLSPDGFATYRRACVAGGTLGVYVSQHEGVLAPVRALLSLVAGALGRDAQTVSGECTVLTINSRRGKLAVSLDGETLDLRTPLRFRSHPGGLKVLVPPMPLEKA